MADRVTEPIQPVAPMQPAAGYPSSDQRRRPAGNNLVFLYLFVAFLLAPKIDLIRIEVAAIRPDDFITLLALGLYFLRRRRSFVLPIYVKSYFAFVLVCLTAALVNIDENGLKGVVFSVRLLQYTSWFFIGYHMAFAVGYRQVRSALLFVSVILLIWGIGEYFGVISKVGRFAMVEDRLSINTSGPFEASVVLAILAFAARQWLVTPVLILLVWFTQARITLVASAISLVFRRPGQALLIGALSAILVVVASGPIAAVLKGSRFAEAQSPTQMFNTLIRTMERAPVTNPASYKARFLTGGEMIRYVELGDAGTSFNIRAIRWTTVIKSTLAAPARLLIGWGPGAWGLALDGYYVRVFGETGLIGMAVFLFWMYATYRELRRGSIAAFAFVMLVVVAIFIDIFSASKVMPMLWMFAALDHARHPHSFSSTSAWLPGPKRGSAGNQAI